MICPPFLSAGDVVSIVAPAGRINDNDLVLVKSQHTAKNKEIVLALIDDEATIKEINYTDNAVILKPKSTNPMNKPIILTNDFNIQGVVVTSFSGL